ncbi:MAG: Eco29kI family restriction endonuclease [Bacillota bacterium]
MVTRDDYFNPLDKESLAKSLAAAFMRQPCRPMPPEPIVGAGVYALYYGGKLPFYELVARHNKGNVCKEPIYVGKAIPKGGRKGGIGFNALEGNALFTRLREHAKSIEQAQNLSLDDFRYRYLVVDDIWIPLAENILISIFRPLWNVIVDGFGIHDPGEGRKRQAKSDWDTIHPGRPFTRDLPEKKTANQIIARIQEFFGNFFSRTT